MILLDLHVLLFMYLSISTTVSQWYGLRHASHFTPIRCKERRVYSLLQCAALGRESKDVRFSLTLKINIAGGTVLTYIGNKQTTKNGIITVCIKILYMISFGSVISSKHMIVLIQLSFYLFLGVDEKRNAALFRPCSASSVFNNFHHYWGTTFATDGVYLIFETTQVYASGYENAPWLTVILEGPLVISFVRVFNRLDRDGELLCYFY